MTKEPPIRVVVASKHPASDFATETMAGRSLSSITRHVNRIEVVLYPDNTSGLPDVYNQEIERARNDPALLVFMHDDVELCDLWWWRQIRVALRTFDLVGSFGCKERFPRMCSVLCTNPGDSILRENLLGFIGIGETFPPRKLVLGGLACCDAQLLDGVFLCGFSETFIKNEIRFDPKFSFHFYDLDVCRQFEMKGLRMGTWNVSMIHKSDGGSGYNSPEWSTGYERYLEKWTE